MKYILLCLLFIVGCTPNLEKVSRKEIRGNDFNSELARNYQVFAKSEAEQYDWLDAEYFAFKALKLDAGTYLDPERPEEWKETRGNLEELRDLRARLLAHITSENIANHPKALADAQYYYDCLVEEEEENWQFDKIATCRENFKKSLTLLDEIKEKSNIITRDEVPEVKVFSAVIYFNFNESGVTEDQLPMLKDVAETSKNQPSVRVMIVGHSDLVGSDKYNMELSKKRALEVRKILVEYGVDANKIQLSYLGKAAPAVNTKHRERLNRRAAITLN